MELFHSIVEMRFIASLHQYARKSTIKSYYFVKNRSIFVKKNGAESHKNRVPLRLKIVKVWENRRKHR